MFFELAKSESEGPGQHQVARQEVAVSPQHEPMTAASVKGAMLRACRKRFHGSNARGGILLAWIAALRSFPDGVNSCCARPLKNEGDNAMTKAILALVIAAIATPAFAQTGTAPNLMSDGVKLKTEEEVKAEQEREARYKSGLSKIPDSKNKQDPWGSVRSTSTPAQNPARQGSK
jgi:hypothetical protein